MAIAQTPLSKGFCYFRLWFHSNAAEQLKLEQAGFLFFVLWLDSLWLRVKLPCSGSLKISIFRQRDKLTLSPFS